MEATASIPCRSGFGATDHRDHLIENVVGHVILVHHVQHRLASVGKKEGHAVGVGAEARIRRSDQVGCNHVQVLGDNLLARIGLHVTGLGGKAHQNLSVALALADGLEDVRGTGQGQLDIPLAFLDLVGFADRRPVVGNRRHLDDHVGLVHPGEDRLGHLLHADHRHHIHIERRRQRHRAAHQGDRGAAVFGGPGNGVAHLARRGIADEAHRIDGLPGRSGGHQHPFAGQIVGREKTDQAVDDFLGFGQPSGSGGFAGQFADTGRQNLATVGRQAIQVALGGRMFEHVGIHRGADHHRAGHGQHERAQGVIGDAACQFGHRVGRGRRDDHGLGRFGPVDMPDGRLILVIKQIPANRIFRKHGECHGTDETRRALGHDHAYPGTELFQAPDEFHTFIGGDAAAHAQNDMLVFENRMFHDPRVRPSASGQVTIGKPDVAQLPQHPAKD
ncbi:putative phosphopantothenoylcysteine decarboxylase/phosphopantothenate-cysteine ligase [Desulfosarcina cetonica]|nr:putative phosphopantothenoylcysteine decarboxylase/phosphopantothenate-cysteine ligase [Desulfosarcina cetonica]